MSKNLTLEEFNKQYAISVNTNTRREGSLISIEDAQLIYSSKNQPVETVAHVVYERETGREVMISYTNDEEAFIANVIKTFHIQADVPTPAETTSQAVDSIQNGDMHLFTIRYADDVDDIIATTMPYHKIFELYETLQDGKGVMDESSPDYIDGTVTDILVQLIENNGHRVSVLPVAEGFDGNK